MSSNPVIYVVLSKELKMSPGKAAAQAVHAAMMLSMNSRFDFMDSYRRTVIVLGAESGEQIKNLYTYLDDADIEADYYIDEGKNEVGAYSVTALAAGPVDLEDEEKRAIFADLPLYGEELPGRSLIKFLLGILAINLALIIGSML